MKTKIINFVGAPSTGKSVMAAYTFAILKTLHFKTEYIQEVAKFLIYQQRFDELNNQYSVSTKQYLNIKAVDGKVQYICLDSPLLLGLYYNKQYTSNVSNIEKTEKMILSKMSEFDNVYIFLEKNKNFPFEKEGRVHSENESIEIEVELKKLLDTLGIPYLTITSNIKNIQQILDYIK
jgi:nicotinamide riboside kinase